ncbi:MAG: M48 family metalloprotease [Clostridia bacterium]|nr:M48 family metalloprotease [Clostridia bacterium]
MRVVPPNRYYHPQDQKALDALKAIPGFTTVLKSFMKTFSEQMLHGVNMANKIRLGPDQMPEIYHLLPPICEALGIEEPELYLEMDPAPNAYTYGDTKVFITLTSGLLEYLEEDEIKAVIAHECGHIACRHVLYHTMADMILSGSEQFLDIGLLSLPLKLALYYWKRCSEFSCDRAAAVYMQGSSSMVETMIRLAGGSKDLTSKINADLFLQQAKDYDTLIDESKLNKALQYLMVMNQEHPFLAVRAHEIDTWCKSDDFKTLMEYANGTDKTCPACGALVEDGWQFCKKCGKELV